MFLKSLLAKSYLKEGDLEDSEILILPKGIKAGIDCNMVISNTDFEELMVDYRSTEPASEGILMTIGTTKDINDPVWNVLVMNDAVTERYVELSNQMYAARNEASEGATGVISTPPMDNMATGAALPYGTYTRSTSTFVPPVVSESDDEDGASLNAEGMKVVHDGGAFINSTVAEGTKVETPIDQSTEDTDGSNLPPAETQFDDILPSTPTEPVPETEAVPEPQESSLVGESFPTEPVVLPVPAVEEEYHDPLASFNATLTGESDDSDTTKEPSASFTPPASMGGDDPFARLDFDMMHDQAMKDSTTAPAPEPEPESEPAPADGDISSLTALLSQTDEEHKDDGQNNDGYDVPSTPAVEEQTVPAFVPPTSEPASPVEESVGEEPVGGFTPPAEDAEDGHFHAPVFQPEPEPETTPIPTEPLAEPQPASEGQYAEPSGTQSTVPESEPEAKEESEDTAEMVAVAVSKINTILDDFQEMSKQYGINNICTASGVTFGAVVDTITNRGCTDLIPFIESCGGDENLLASNIADFVKVIRETAVDYAMRNELHAVNNLLYPIIKLIYEEG